MSVSSQLHPQERGPPDSEERLSQKKLDHSLGLLGRARAFMTEVRTAQKAAGGTVPGFLLVDEWRTQTAINDSGLMKTVSKWVCNRSLMKLFKRFEEMCEWREMPLDAGLRPAVYKLLAVELWLNARSLGAPSKHLCPVTLYHGFIADELIGSEEFKQFVNTPGVFRVAAINHAYRPKEFLRDVQKNIVELSEDEEFAGLRNRRGLFRQAAINNPSNPRSFLRKCQAGKSSGPAHPASCQRPDELLPSL